MEIKAVDLFAGGGGFSLGFLNTGFKIVAAFDNWPPAVALYRENFKNHPILELDLSSAHAAAKEILKFNPDMIIGGPPCQDFSSAGKRNEALGRATLTINFAEIVNKVLPKWFVMENVDRAKMSRSIKEAVKLFKKTGYGLTQIIIDASFCGVPQKRKRLFIIGELGGCDNGLMWRLLNNLDSKPTTMRDYFGDKLDFDHYYRHPRSYKRRGVFSIDEPSPTIRGVNRPVPDGYPGHPGDSAPLSETIHPLTTKERCQIQTFPEDFKLIGSKTDLEQIIGNAVPVKLAEYVALQLKEYIQERAFEQNKNFDSNGRHVYKKETFRYNESGQVAW